MGNKKLRREADRILRENGYGRLYHGKKRRCFKFYNAGFLKRVIFIASLKPGDIIHDCDGFNHRLAEKPTIDRSCTFFEFHQLKFDDGAWSCGCPYGPWKPATVEHIRSYHNVDDDWIEKLKKQGWWTERNQKLVDLIRAGKPITDEFGIKLPDL